MDLAETSYQKIIKGENLTFHEALELVDVSSPEKLYSTADAVRKKFHGNRLDLCSIVNARSGKCSENCKFCSQSTHFKVDVDRYEQVETAQAVALARENEEHGVQRFSLVTSGRSVSMKQLDELAKIFSAIREESGISLCASMGFLTLEKALKLKEMGVTRYHCNLEASQSYFPEVCSSHSWEEKVETIQLAKTVGLQVCSGGILGMGESVKQRLELAFELRELEIESIPLNILTPIENTPFGHLKPPSVSEVLTAVAMFRLINPRAIIRIAGGRNLLADQQHSLFTSGANGSIVGNYLTTLGNSLEEDAKMFQSLGFDQLLSPTKKTAPVPTSKTLSN